MGERDLANFSTVVVAGGCIGRLPFSCVLGCFGAPDAS